MTNCPKHCSPCTRAVIKGGATLSFTEFPSSVPVVDAIFVNNPGEDPSPGFRSSSRTTEAGHVEDGNENVESKETQTPPLGSIHNSDGHQTEYTPNLRGALQKPRSFTQQKGGAEGDAEKSDVKTETEGAKDEKAGRTSKKDEYKNGKAEEISKKHEHREEMQRTSCTGNSEDGACLDSEEQKSVSLGSADAIAAASSSSTALSPATIPLGSDVVSETRSPAASRNPATTVNAATSTNTVSTTLNARHAGFTASAASGSLGANVDAKNIAPASTALVTTSPTTVSDFENSRVSPRTFEPAVVHSGNNEEDNNETNPFYQAMKKCIDNKVDKILMGEDMMIRVDRTYYSCWKEKEIYKPKECLASFTLNEVQLSYYKHFWGSDIVNCRGTLLGGKSLWKLVSQYRDAEKQRRKAYSTQPDKNLVSKMQESEVEMIRGDSWLCADNFVEWFASKGTDEAIVSKYDLGFYHDMKKCIGDVDAKWDEAIVITSKVYECTRKHKHSEYCKAHFEFSTENWPSYSQLSWGYYIVNCRGEELGGRGMLGFQPRTWIRADKFLEWFVREGTEEGVIFKPKSLDKYLEEMENCVASGAPGHSMYEKLFKVIHLDDPNYNVIGIRDLFNCWKKYYKQDTRNSNPYTLKKHYPDNQIKKHQYVQPYECLAYIEENENNQIKVQNCYGEATVMFRRDKKYYRNSVVEWFAGNNAEAPDFYERPILIVFLVTFCVSCLCRCKLLNAEKPDDMMHCCSEATYPCLFQGIVTVFNWYCCGVCCLPQGLEDLVNYERWYSVQPCTAYCLGSQSCVFGWMAYKTYNDNEKQQGPPNPSSSSPDLPCLRRAFLIYHVCAFVIQLCMILIYMGWMPYCPLSRQLPKLYFLPIERHWEDPQDDSYRTPVNWSYLMCCYWGSLLITNSAMLVYLFMEFKIESATGAKVSTCTHKDILHVCLFEHICVSIISGFSISTHNYFLYDKTCPPFDLWWGPATTEDKKYSRYRDVISPRHRNIASTCLWIYGIGSGLLPLGFVKWNFPDGIKSIEREEPKKIESLKCWQKRLVCLQVVVLILQSILCYVHMVLWADTGPQ